MADPNYNMMALQGYDVDDEDYSKMYGMPSELAGTSEVNTWMLDHVYQKNISHYKDIGLPDKEAESKAKLLRSQTRKQINELVAQKGLK